MFGPVFERASERHADAVFGKVDTEAQPTLADALGISLIPTLMVIRDGVVLYARPGALPDTRAGAADRQGTRAGHGRGPGKHRRACGRGPDRELVSAGPAA